jgi:hypothetical protein
MDLENRRCFNTAIPFVTECRRSYMLTNDSFVGTVMSQFSIHWCNILTWIFKSTNRVCGLDLFCIWHLNFATVSLGVQNMVLKETCILLRVFMIRGVVE